MANNWFPHDSTASTDQRVLQLRSEFGNVGYSWFFMTLEWLWQSADAKADMGSIDSLSFFLREDRTIIERFIKRCIDLELFIVDKQNRFFSFRRVKEKELLMEKSKNAKRAVSIREAKRRTIDENNKIDSGIDRSSNDTSNDHLVPYRTVPDHTDTLVSVSALADPKVLDELEKFVHWLNATKIFPSPKIITKAVRSKWASRRKRYSARDLVEAFANLTREPDRWKLENNGQRPLAWWLHTDERIEEMRNCHLKKSSFSPKVGIIL